MCISDKIQEAYLNKENIEKKLYELEMMSFEEKKKLLVDFNNTAINYIKDISVHKLFEMQVQKTPDKTALTAYDRRLSYRELNDEANRIAHSLIEKGIGRGDIVAFMLPRRSELIAAMLGILKSGAAYLPMDPDYPQDRLRYMMSDSGAKLCITEENIAGLLDHTENANPEIITDSTDICYCIYTSGSTGKPKGTLITHKNVVNYISDNQYNVLHKIIKDGYRSIVSVTTAGFDIFVTESLLPLANGMEMIFANEEQARRQTKLNELLKVTPADVIQTTPTKLKSLLTDRTQLEYLQKVKVIMIGGEALEPSLVEELKGLTDAEIFNVYGPTETTVWVTNAEVKDSDIHIGKPMANTQIYIVDKYMNPVPVGVTGELCIAGDCVCAGYLNRPELTAEKFIENPFGEGRLYRTGDLACWREDGNIVYVGRNDFQVKIRGLRIELGEIENAVSAIEGIHQSVAVVQKNSEGRQFICAFYTGEEKPAQEIRNAVGRKLPKYMIPHIFMHLDEMPLTSNSKINRKMLPEVELESIKTGAEYKAPETKEEQILVDTVREVLGCDQVSILDNFFDIGGDSLKAIELTSRLELSGYETSVKTVFACENMKELAANLIRKEVERAAAAYGSVIPATPAQLRVYTAQLMKPDSTLYNIPYVFRVEELDGGRLEAAVQELAARHESLRTHFENREGQIVQVINENARVSVEKLGSDMIEAFVRPFDLTKAPLIRVGYYQNTVMIDMHHIMIDGESMPVLFRELNELYMGRAIVSEPVQYGEFAVQKTDHEKSERYWLEILGEEIPVLELPADHARKEKQSFNGSVLYDRIDMELHEKIREKCRELGITPYVYYMSCFQILLSKFSGNEDIVVAMPVSGREGRFLETVGMFVNTIALRSRPEGRKTVLDFMKEIKRESVSAIEHQDYPFNELVKKLHLEIGGRNPLYDVMLAYQSEAMTDIVFGDQKAELLPIPVTTSKCDLTFTVMPRKEDVVVMAEYCMDLYEQETIQRFIDSYRRILGQCLSEGKFLKDIEAMDQREKEKILYDFNNTTVNYPIPASSTIYSLFEQNARNMESKICIETSGASITFGELLDLSKALDYEIRSITNGKKSIVAVIAERSIEMYAAIYGIIRGGNAYLPISPDYPPERIDYILKDSSAALVITQNKFVNLAGDAVCIDMTGFINNTPKLKESLPCAAVENDTAYVIYTSGSTGKPKGAKVSHKSAVNRILWMHNKYPMKQKSVILQKTPYTFDVSVWELFWWGMCGGSLAVSKPGEHFLPAKILNEVYEHHVTHLHFVPSVFELFLTYLENHADECYKFHSAKYVFLSGEALAASLVQRFYALFDYKLVTLHNLYGPTECAVDVTYYDCTPDDIDPVPIGKPIYNTSMYVVDKYMNPLPIGVKGELCIGGVNVGQGYLNKPELTTEKFVVNPFGEGKLYKTGDLAYICDDGRIIYCGRMDGQIKLNGQRIEIGEIEAVIESFPEVDSVAVIMRKVNGRDTLVAYYCGQKNIEDMIRKHCEAKLPKYMVPGSICYIEELPLNPSGKLDRKVLASLEVAEANTSVIEEPIGKEECFICEAFCRILKIEKVGRNSDFFALGGSSLSMISLLSEDAFKEIAAVDFMANPTPAKLAGLLIKNQKTECDYVETLWKSEKNEKTIVLFPFAGGGAEAYANLMSAIKSRRDDISIYFVRYLHSTSECEQAAAEISKLFGDTELYFYSHCAGSAVVMQIINFLEKENKSVVRHYIAGGNIPEKKPRRKNVWNLVPDRTLKAILVKAGAPLKEISEDKLTNVLSDFRKDTDFNTQYFAKKNPKIKCKVSVVISKEDIFTTNYKDAEKLWEIYVQNVDEIHFIESRTHYFQSEHSEELADIILSKLVSE